MTDAGRFTPGPWKHVPNTGVVRYDGADKNIGSVHICRVGDYRDKELLPFNKERWDADARLIAAAPDLYDEGAFLLDRLAQFASCVETDESYREWAGHVEPAIARFRAALSKATVKPGGAPQADASVPPQTLSNEVAG